MDHYDVLDDDDHIDVVGRRRSYNYYNDYDHHTDYYYFDDSNNGLLQRWWRRWFGGDSSNTQWGIVVALLVICAMQFQFQSYLWGLWYRIRNDGVAATATDMVFALVDTLRAYLQLAMELVRSLRHQAPLNYFLDGVFGNGAFDEEYYEQYPAANPGGGFFSSAAALGPPPPLVIVGPNGQIEEEEESSNNNDHRSPSPASSFTSQSTTTTRGIEPAFLNEEDYPPGWLVYHAELGVVPKEEADNYDAMLRRKQEEAQKKGDGEKEDEKKIAEVNEVKASGSAATPASDLDDKMQNDSAFNSNASRIEGEEEPIKEAPAASSEPNHPA